MSGSHEMLEGQRYDVIFFLFWLCQVAWDLVPQRGIEPMASAVKCSILTTGLQGSSMTLILRNKQKVNPRMKFNTQVESFSESRLPDSFVCTD